MDRRRVIHAAAFAIAPWVLIAAVYGVFKFLVYIFRNDENLAVTTLLIILYSVAFGFLGWQLSGLKSWNRRWFGRKGRGGWGTRAKNTSIEDESDEAEWRRR